MDNETDRPYPDAGAPGTARTRRGTYRIRTALLSSVLLTVGLALTSCGGGGSGTAGGQESSDSGVASLVTPSSNGGRAGADPSAQSSSAVEAKRPQLRLDSSQEEIDRLWDVYWACLQAHGVPMNTTRVDRPGEQAPPVDDAKVAYQYKEQFQACLYKMPLQPVEERPETNPHYADDHRAYVSCLKSKGLKVHAVFGSDGSPDGWTYDEDAPQDAGGLPADKIDHDCRLEAFGGKGKN